MCSKQLLLRNTACKTGLSEHCRISGTAAKIGNKEHDSLFLRHQGNQMVSPIYRFGTTDIGVLSIWLWREIRLSSQLCLS